MRKVLPHRLKYLRLLPLESLRERISGRVGLDVDVLRSVTSYTGCGDGDVYIAGVQVCPGGCGCARCVHTTGGVCAHQAKLATGCTCAYHMFVIVGADPIL